jgi:pimeloyl-ACP methyl ester carboxylesterase
MNHPNPCGQECSACPTAATCTVHHTLGDVAPIDLADALQRFQREAAHGTCDTGRYRMPYYTWGAGPPLLCIHGLLLDAESFVLPVARLSCHFRCIAYTLPTGAGDGARLGRLGHADLVADVWALLDHLGLERCYVYGSSFGATVALAALADRPERLPRAILQGGFARRPLRPAEWCLAQLVRRLPGTLRSLPGHDGIMSWVHGPSFADRPTEVWRHFLDRGRRTPMRAAGHRAMLLRRLDLRPVLARVRQPVLLIHGDRDPVVAASCAAELMRGLPNVGQVLFEGCGHVPTYTHPEMLAALVRQFLTPPGVA